MTTARFHINRIFSYRAVWHLVFWIAFTIMYTLIYGSNQQEYLLKLKHTLILLTVFIPASYFTIYFLMMQLFLKKKYLQFLLYFLLSATFFSLMYNYVNVLFVRKLYVPDSKPDFHLELFVILRSFVLCYAVVALSIVFKLLKLWYETQKKYQDLQKEKLVAELNFLKSQIHPHFLFNTLNNLYSLALDKSEKTPEGILKLSELLDFMLYKSNAETVSLKQEIALLNNYIDLERLRYSNRLDITNEISGLEDHMEIAPLILLAFVENAFKHGVSKKSKQNIIHLKIHVDGNYLNFYIANSKSQEKNPDKDESSNGIGLKNVKRRLELLYPGQYQLKITDTENMYIVHLRIRILRNENQNKMPDR